MTIAPSTHPMSGLPARVTLYEVGPRDGLQNEPVSLDVGVKAEFIERLVDAGIRAIELTSMVRPERIPQLADAEQLLRRLELPEDVRTVVLVPNERGLQRVLHFGISEIAIFASATETFSQRNLGRSISESFRMFEPVVQGAHDADVRVRAYVSMCFGDPWEGHVPISRVVDTARRLVDLGCHELSIGDTVGTGTPGHVAALISALVDAGLATTMLAAHFHDTYGQALANILAALQCGISTVDASAGALGGCPFALSATGNVATEDVLWQLHGLDIATGIDLVAVVETSEWLNARLGRTSPSRSTRAVAARMSRDPSTSGT